MNLPALPTYSCIQKPFAGLPSGTDDVWNGIEAMELLETAGGDKPTLATTVQAFWTEEALYYRFVCEDDRIVATLSGHDAPIYDEDVVEVFLSEACDFGSYKEFEQSPANVLFDATIKNNLDGTIEVNTGWHAAGWETTVERKENGSQMIYVWKLPFANFEGGTPSPGDEWLMNCYRIDRGATKKDDQYMAWSTTGIVDFHTPKRFGTIRFV
ncbi:carbohydrate-binding family 9-like protein [Paenibacillus sp. MBLB4367]|uniref:carbohydrate-binding family 9-like protein n=1 Tax=Paenibacillus sp. MBLB4367 TaxID=3384767 RepID=UPI0039080C45